MLKPHIGCAVLAIPRPSLKSDGSMSCTSSVLNLSGHKDEALCRLLAERACVSYQKTCLCTGGFHVDNMSAQQIQEVVQAVEGLAPEEYYKEKAKTKMDERNNCPQCPRHCPADALSCGRGRAYFDQENDAPKQGHGHGEHDHKNRGSHEEHGDHHSKPGKNTVEGLLRICGHKLHHGGVDGDLCAALSEGEQKQLKELLTKLVESWN